MSRNDQKLKQELKNLLLEAREKYKHGDFQGIITITDPFMKLLAAYQGSKIVREETDGFETWKRESILDFREIMNKIEYHLQSKINSVAGMESIKTMFKSTNILNEMRRAFVYQISPEDESLFFYNFLNSETKM